MKQRCKYYCQRLERECRQVASIGGYCISHFRLERQKDAEAKQKNVFPVMSDQWQN